MDSQGEFLVTLLEAAMLTDINLATSEDVLD